MASNHPAAKAARKKAAAEAAEARLKKKQSGLSREFVELPFKAIPIKVKNASKLSEQSYEMARGMFGLDSDEDDDVSLEELEAEFKELEAERSLWTAKYRPKHIVKLDKRLKKLESKLEHLREEALEEEIKSGGKVRYSRPYAERRAARKENRERRKKAVRMWHKSEAKKAEEAARALEQAAEEKAELEWTRESLAYDAQPEKYREFVSKQEHETMMKLINVIGDKK